MLKFFEYFRVEGTLSVLAWIVAVCALAYSRRCVRHRWRWMFSALAAAVVGWEMAQVTSDAIMDARIDDRDQVKAVVAGNLQLDDLAERDVKISARFAEDEAGDRTTLSDVTAMDAPTNTPSGGGQSAAEPPPTVPSVDGITTNASSAEEPEYRKGGKKTRSAGKKLEGKKGVDVKLEEVVIRYMKADDLAAAKILDTLNRFIAKWVLLMALGLIVWDYLRAFNGTLTTRWLMPIGGRWLDTISPRARMTLVTPKVAAGGLSPAEYAALVLRKGEQVLHFGSGDLWPGCERLARVAVGSRTIWGIRKLTAGGPGVPPGAEFLLDGAWFGRYAVVCAAPGALAEVVDLLWKRYETGASARRAIHLVWSAVESPSDEVLDSLQRIAADTNIKLVVWMGGDTVPSELRGSYDEVCDTLPE